MDTTRRNTAAASRTSWEENRGIGKSYGFNRAEGLDDYQTPEDLLFMLVDIVSRGGNFLLNIGPTADGRIPLVMQSRLRAMGEWLATHGEAIYGTRPWIRSCQWSEGSLPEFGEGNYKTGYSVRQFTLEPSPGDAEKECWFTSKDNTLYVLLPRRPGQPEIVLHGVPTTARSTIEFIDRAEPIHWTRETNGDLKIELLSGPKRGETQLSIIVVKITEVSTER